MTLNLFQLNLCSRMWLDHQELKKADINKVNVYFGSIITDTSYSKKNKTLEYSVDTYYGLKDIEYLYNGIDDCYKHILADIHLKIKIY